MHIIGNSAPNGDIVVSKNTGLGDKRVKGNSPHRQRQHHHGNVQVPADGVCVLNGVTVNGTVTAGTNAYFESKASKISGDVVGTQAMTLYLWGRTMVSGNIAGDQTPQVFVYDSVAGRDLGASNASAPGWAHFQVCGTAVGGDLSVASMGPDVLIGDPDVSCLKNSVQGDLYASNNATDRELYVIGNT